MEKHLEAHLQVLGEDHPQVLVTLANLSVIYAALGQYEDAVNIEEKVLKGRKKFFGPEHLETLRSMLDLGGKYRNVGMVKRRPAYCRCQRH